MIIASLHEHHDCRRFCCGIDALDRYLKRRARPHAAANLSRSYVALDGKQVCGYYSLSMAGIRRNNLPPAQHQRWSRFPLPVARLTRLAVDQRHQRQGLGELLLADALQRCLQACNTLGMAGVLIDADHKPCGNWYERYEFVRLRDNPLTLWLPTTAIAQL